MENFLCDLLEVTDLSTLSPSLTESGAIAANGTLAYTHLYTHPRVIRVLRFSAFHQAVFGVRPALKLFSSVPETYEEAIEYLEKETVYRFAAADLMAIKDGSQFKAAFDRFTSKEPGLFDREVKRELWASLKDRLTITSSVAFDDQKTLYANWLALGPIARITDSDLQSNVNPLTHYAISKLSTAAATRSTPIARYELAAYLFSKDFHLQRILYNGKVLVSDVSEDVEVHGFAKFEPSVVFAPSSQVSNALALCANTFACDEPDLLAFVPRIAALCFFTRSTPLVLSRTPTNSARIVVHSEMKVLPGLQAYHIGAQISTLLGQMLAFPVPMIDLLFTMYQHARPKATALFPTGEVDRRENCILVIDNRENVMTVISTIITLKNLDPKKWDLVIFTTKESQPFYERHLPMCRCYFAHSLLSPKVKFNLDTYNRIMKDDLLWLQLAGHGYQYALTIQDDGLILRPGVERFLEQGYHYLGSPWIKSQALADAGVPDTMVGNGGLSLRNISTMGSIASSSSRKNDLFGGDIQPIPEDVFYAAEVARRGLKVPTLEDASKFGMEQIFSEHALGIHKAWGYIQWPQLLAYMKSILPLYV